LELKGSVGSPLLAPQNHELSRDISDELRATLHETGTLGVSLYDGTLYSPVLGEIRENRRQSVTVINRLHPETSSTNTNDSAPTFANGASCLKQGLVDITVPLIHRRRLRFGLMLVDAKEPTAKPRP
jgi:hypothetical protein